MRTGSHLTIQDYIKQANAPGGAGLLHRSAKAVLSTDQDGFSNTLAAARRAMNERPQGRSIQDYLKNPVRVQRLVRTVQPPDQASAPPMPAAAKAHEITCEGLSAASQMQRSTPAAQPMAHRINAGVDQAAAKYDLPSELIHAVIRAESNYQVRAVSPAGARGLMQLMPATAKELGVRNAFDIEQNIEGGAKYLRSMLDRFNGDLKLALSAYNAGPGNVEKYKGQVPFVETRTYVARVLRFVEQSPDSAV